MKTFVIILIALIATYLTGVGVCDDWNIFTGLSPKGIVSTIATLTFVFLGYAFVMWVILTGLFDL